MASALSASRDFLAQALARVRDGASAYGRDLDQPGKEIKVDPFGPGEASTRNGLLRLGLAVASAYRRRANEGAARETAALASEKARAEIARMQAETSRATSEGHYYEGRNAGTAPAPAPIHLSRAVGPYAAGSNVDPREVSGYITTQGQAAAERRAKIAADARTASVSHRADAQAALRALDAEEGRNVDNSVALYRRAVVGRLLQQYASGDPATRERARQQLGFSEMQAEYPSDLHSISASHSEAIKALEDRYRSVRLAQERAGNAGRREKYQRVIDEAALSAQADAQAPRDAENPDPLNILTP